MIIDGITNVSKVGIRKLNNRGRNIMRGAVLVKAIIVLACLVGLAIAQEEPTKSNGTTKKPDSPTKTPFDRRKQLKEIIEKDAQAFKTDEPKVQAQQPKPEPERPVTMEDADAPKIPQPDPDAIVKMRPLVRNAYRAAIDRAKKPADKAKLAADLLKDATEVTNDEANRLVLLTMARDLAVDAKARKTAVDATVAIADRYQPAPGEPTSTQDQFDKAEQLWKDIKEALKQVGNTQDRDKEKLRLQIKAIEWYARAMTGATGLTKQLCEKRIEEATKEKEVEKAAKKAVANRKSHKQPSLPDGCVLYFDFEQDGAQNAGQTWVMDKSGCRNHGQVIGNVKPVEGRIGLGAEFDGNSGYIQVKNSPSLNPTAFTLAAWINAREWQQPISFMIYKLEKNRESSQGYAISYNLPGVLVYQIGGTDNRFTRIAGRQAIATGTWVHIAATFDGGQLTLYVNGNHISTRTVDPKQVSINSSADLFIGSHSRTQKWRFNGTIDEVMIFNRAMPTQEILQLAQPKVNAKIAEAAKRPMEKATKEVTKASARAKPKAEDNRLQDNIGAQLALSDAEQKETCDKQRAFLEKVGQKIPGSGMKLYETKRFFFYSDAPPPTVSSLMTSFDAVYNRLCEIYDIDPKINIWKGKAIILSFADWSSLEQYQSTYIFRRGGPDRTIPREWTIFHFFSGRPLGWHSTYFITSKFTRQYLGQLGSLDPAWLDIGISGCITNYVMPGEDARFRRRPVETTATATIESMQRSRTMGTFFTERPIGAPNEIATSFINFLLAYNPTASVNTPKPQKQESVSKCFHQFLKKLRAGAPWQKSLEEAYGMSLEELVKQYGMSLGIPDLRPW